MIHQNEGEDKQMHSLYGDSVEHVICFVFHIVELTFYFTRMVVTIYIFVFK